MRRRVPDMTVFHEEAKRLRIADVIEKWNGDNSDVLTGDLSCGE